MLLLYGRTEEGIGAGKPGVTGIFGCCFPVLSVNSGSERFRDNRILLRMLLTVDAFVVAKQQGMIQQQIPNAGDATGGHGFTLQEQPWYKITFRMTDSTEKEFNVDNQSFRELKEGEKGILTYQGTRYLGFKKDS